MKKTVTLIFILALAGAILFAGELPLPAASPAHTLVFSANVNGEIEPCG